MSSSCISSLDRLELQGRRLSLNSLVGLVRTLKLELMFLRTIVNWILSLPSDGLLKQKVRDLQEAYWSINDDVIQLHLTYGPHSGNIVIKLSRILERVKHIKPSVKEVCDLHLEREYPRSSWLFQSAYIMEFISDLQDNLKHLFRLKGNDVSPVKKQIEVLEQKLEFLTDVTEFTTKHSAKGAAEVEDLMVHIRAVTDNMILVCYSCLVEEMDESMAREIKLKLSDLLLNIKLFNPQVRQIYIRAYKSLHVHDSRWTDILEVVSVVDFILLDLMELLHYNTNYMVPINDCVGNLHEKTKFLKPIFVDLPVQHKTEKVRYLMRNIYEVMRELGPIIYSFSAEDTDEDMSGVLNCAVLELLESIKLTEEEFRLINLHKFPSIDELSSFDFILENLRELLTRETNLVATLKHQINTVHTELLYLRSSLVNIKETRDEHGEQNDIWRRVIVVAYRAEFVVDSIAVKDGPACYHMLQLETVVEEIKIIKSEIMKIYENNAHDIVDSSPTRTSSQATIIRETTPNFHELVVGFEEEAEALKEMLIAPSKRQDVFAIVGLPGLGKTTLAKKLYDDPSFEKLFDVRAWCCVSRTYHNKDMLLAILGDVIELPDRVNEMKNEELAELLYKSLKGLRYLIVMDDMWDVGAWNALRRSFPDDKKGSRILITSRFHDMALQATPGRNIHPLRLFHDDESWKLLQGKLFHGENCPEELSEAGKQIAINCKGLPLSVVLAAGLLSSLDKTESQWQQFAENFRSATVSEDPSNQCMAILELSYRNLPDHLKSCFLYFGAFPENQEISARKLAWFWIAEGFVHDTNSESLEDVAENYLMDLIGRSLVIGSKSTSDNGVKSCRIHDLLRDFCLTKADKENFLHSVRDGFNYDVDSNYPNSSSIISYEQYRLSIYSTQQQFIQRKPLGPNVRSLLLHPFGDSYATKAYDASFICHCFKLVRILDLGYINIGKSFGGIELLVNLRFLAVRGDMGSIPSSIANLWRLETFLLNRINSEVVLVPDSIWNMMRLRHVHINETASFNLNPQILENSSILEKLETFSTPSLAYGDDVEKMLRKLPNLRKLRCIFLDAWDHVQGCNQFPELSSLAQLVSLKVSGIHKLSPSSQRFPCEFHFPLNLRKLTLSDFSLPWSEFSSIGTLPNLEVLKLLHRAFEGESWDMKEAKFRKLKHLKLESLDIVEWKAATDNVPCLEQVVLRKCKKLQEIPSTLARIATLEMIKVQWCSSAAASSASNILVNEKDLVNKSLKVHIYPRVKDPGASSKEPTLNQ